MLLNSETYFADFLRLHSWSMLEIGTGYSWDSCGIFVGYSWGIRGVFVGYSRSIHGVYVCIGYVSGIYRVCVGKAWEQTGCEGVLRYIPCMTICIMNILSTT